MLKYKSTRHLKAEISKVSNLLEKEGGRETDQDQLGATLSREQTCLIFSILSALPILMIDFTGALNAHDPFYLGLGLGHHWQHLHEVPMVCHPISL